MTIDYLLCTRLYKENKEAIENNIALKIIISNVDSPELLVKTYLQKFIPIMNWIKKIVRKKGNWLSSLLKYTITKPKEIERKIIPIISARPATAWLKNPIFDNANSSVKTKSWTAK